MRSSKVLNLIYSNICGPFEVLSLGRNKYLISFIDELSIKYWLFLIKTKSKTLNAFKKFKNMVEIKNGKVVKVLRTYVGGHFNS